MASQPIKSMNSGALSWKKVATLVFTWRKSGDFFVLFVDNKYNYEFSTQADQLWWNDESGSEMLEESMGRAEVAANSGNEKWRLSQTIEELIGSVGT